VCLNFCGQELVDTIFVLRLAMMYPFALLAEFYTRFSFHVSEIFNLLVFRILVKKLFLRVAGTVADPFS